VLQGQRLFLRRSFAGMMVLAGSIGFRTRFPIPTGAGRTALRPSHTLVHKGKAVKTSDYLQRQNAALAEVQRITGQIEAGTIAQAEGFERIEAIMQSLEKQTADHVPQRQAAREKRRLLTRWVTLAVLGVVALAAMAYFADLA
jgi:hypothetical protein